jgi:hypothetical protein
VRELLHCCPQSPLGAALSCHRFWRDTGNDILIAFLVVEFLLEMWRDPPKSWSPWKSVRFRVWLTEHLPSKGKFMLLAAAMVALGVILERWQGQKADDVADHMRLQLLAAIAPRSLSESDRKAIADACRSVANRLPVQVVMTRGPQGTALGIQIWSALKDGGFDVGVPEFTDALRYEVNVSGPLNHPAALNCVSNALGKKLPIWGLLGVLPNNSPILITVGERLMGKLPE